MSVDKEDDVEDIGLEEQPATSPTGAGGGDDGEAHTTFAAGGYEVAVQNVMVPWFGQILSGIVLLIAITTIKGTDQNFGYGVAASVIAIVFALIGLFLMRSTMGDTPLGTYPYVGELTYVGLVAQFNFIWWFIAAGIMTFSGPFLITSNGYFASWSGVGFAAMALGYTPEKLRSGATSMGFMNGLLVAAIILICAVPSEIGSGKAYHGESVFALVVAIITLVGVLAFSAYPQALDSFQLPFFGVFAIIWVVMACLVTFRGPFLSTGNGYFASWIGAILCVMAAATLKRGLSDNI